MNSLLTAADWSTAMLVADAGLGFLLALGLIVILALLGVISLILKTVFHVIGFVLGGLWRALGGSARKEQPTDAPRQRTAGANSSVPSRSYSADEVGGRICPNDQCGHRNPTPAVYCGRCGRKL